MGGLQFTAIMVPIILLLVAVEILVAKKMGRKVYRFSDSIVNLCVGMLERTVDFFFVILLYFAFDYLFANVALWHIPENPWTWVLALMLGDFLAYCHHFVGHKVNFFWAAHGVHHQSEELNLTTVFRVSAFSVFNRSLFWIWMPILGFSPAFSVSVIVFIGLYQFVTHSRLVGKLGVLEWLLVTPSHHRVHHSRDAEMLDTNYGHVFIIWDRMFGTFYEEKEEPHYGVTTGFESSNPYRAVFSIWTDMFRRAGEAKSFFDKIRIFLKTPAWNPEDARPTPNEFKIDQQGNRVKYRLNIPAPLQWYVFVNVLLVLGAFLGLFIIKNFLMEEVTLKALIGSYSVLFLVMVVLVSAFSFGGLMERKRWSPRFEYFRLGLLILALPLFYREMGIDYLWLRVSGWIVLIILAFWLTNLKSYFTNKSDKSVAPV